MFKLGWLYVYYKKKKKSYYCNIDVPQGKKEDSFVLGENPYQHLVCLQQPDPKKTSKDVKSWVAVHIS